MKRKQKSDLPFCESRQLASATPCYVECDPDKLVSECLPDFLLVGIRIEERTLEANAHISIDTSVGSRRAVMEEHAEDQGKVAHQIKAAVAPGLRIRGKEGVSKD